MDARLTSETLYFEDWGVDLRTRLLFRQDGAGCWTPMPVSSRALDILVCLLEQPGAIVFKDTIMDLVWPNVAVEANNLTVQIAALRRVLDRDRTEGSCIQTVPGRGYRFVAAVTRGESSPQLPLTRPSSDADVARGAGPELQQEPNVVAPPGDARPTVARQFLWRLGGIFASSMLALTLIVVAGATWRSSRLSGARAPSLSIVVLPFASLSDDPDQRYFADAITEDLTTDLSRLANFLVISASTARTYASTPAHAKRIGRDLGVHYMLEGSIERSGGRIRVNAQLIDAEVDAHLWAERFDRDDDDLLALQDDITARIANALDVALVRAEADQPAEQRDALNDIIRGRATLWQPLTRATYAQAVNLFEHALASDPRSVEAQSFLAISLTGQVIGGISSSPEADLSRAEGLINRALMAAPNSAFAHFARGQLLRARHQCDAAIREYDAVLVVNRNNAAATARVGKCKLNIGAPEEAISRLEAAIRLSPRDPELGVWSLWIGQAYLLRSRPDDAIVWFEKALSANTGVHSVRAWLASAYASRRDEARAAAEIAEIHRLTENDRPFTVVRQRALYTTVFETPTIRASLESTYLSGLREAGVPEQ